MEATIRITVTTIIISRSENPSGRLAPLPSCRCMKRPIDAISIVTHGQRKVNSGAAISDPPTCASPFDARSGAHTRTNVRHPREAGGSPAGDNRSSLRISINTLSPPNGVTGLGVCRKTTSFFQKAG